MSQEIVYVMVQPSVVNVSVTTPSNTTVEKSVVNVVEVGTPGPVLEPIQVLEE